MIDRRQMLLGTGTVLALAGCKSPSADEVSASPFIESQSDQMAGIIDPTEALEELGRGYTWSEGPSWDRARSVLYFTDVPGNKAYRWTEATGVEVFLDPSGPEGPLEGFREPGANGLWYARDGSLLVCNHGARAVERMNLDTMQRETLANHYQGKRFNSPNDVVEADNGTLYFTDPTYGLTGLDASSLKEQDANGVYRLDTDGAVTRLVDDMTFPNGCALSPDGRRLYVTQSDSAAPILRVLGLSDDGSVVSDEVLFDVSSFQADDAPGLPDGLAITTEGLVFMTGPGGIFVIDPDGTLLGRIKLGQATANCAFGEDGRTLFITSNDRLLKLRTNVLGVQWG